VKAIAGLADTRSDLQVWSVPPAGFEPATHGLGNSFSHFGDLRLFGR